MAGTNQAPNPEWVHHDMHDIVEKIRIMNEINAQLMQHLATNNSAPATFPVFEDAN